ncbi:MAG: polyphosphate kinase 2 family protein [Chthonomonadales bacterium]|nr:polyphosphate kinase 2 family protein [Chthonomonadales bacterium]
MRYARCIHRGASVRLADIDPSEHCGLSREEAADISRTLGDQLADLADLLFAAGKHGLLVVIQGRDTAGKDGIIRRLLGYVNAQSCRVVPFKVPTEPELQHDFLWRVHARVPGRGEIALFNRSHYEDVLVVRVHDLVPKAVWERRYDHINAFEDLLLDSDTIIVKLMLHISKDEQEERLLEREREIEKSWKLNIGDWKEREFWDAYTEAYEEVFRRCSTKRAPWFVIPSNHKWFRDVAALECIVSALEPHGAEWLEFLSDMGQTRRRELEAFRASLKHA